ncbi:MAG: hypothetical protein HZR80_20385 [Candidatus Heimdallarchaeota archaeon]
MVSNDVFAVILGVIANSVYNIGLVLKKKGACTLPIIEEQSVWQNIKNFSQCKTWVLGFSLTIIQWFPLMYAIKIGSLSLVAPTMGVGFIVLILFSRFFLKERIRIMEIISIVVIIASVVTLNIFDPADAVIFDLVDINSLFKELNAIAFLCAFVVIITLLLIGTYGRKYRQVAPLMAIASGITYAIATIFAKGVVGSLTFANAQDFLINSLKAWQWWMYLFFMCCGYLVAFTSQQMAVQKGKAIVVSPTLDIMNLFTQIMAGVFIFNEWQSSTGTENLIKSVSVSFIIIGVAMLSFFTAQEEEIADEAPEEEEVLDESEHIKHEVQSEEYIEEETVESQKLAEKISTEKINLKHVVPGQQNK